MAKGKTATLADLVKQAKEIPLSSKAKRYSDEDLLNAYIAHGGNLSDAADALGCTRVTMYVRLQKLGVR